MGNNDVPIDPREKRVSELEAEVKRLQGEIAALKGVVEGDDELRRQLQGHDDLLSAIIHSVQVMIVIADPGFENYVINREFSDLTGWEYEDLSKKDVLELYFPDPDYRKDVKRFMESCEEGWRDLKITVRDGSIIDTSWAHFQMMDGRQVAVGINIKERKKAEVDHAKVQNYLDIERNKIFAIINSIPDEIWFCAAGDRRMVLLNPDSLFEQGDGHDPNKAAAIEILNPDGTLRPIEEAPLWRSLNGEVCKGQEVARYSRAGEIRRRLYHSSPVRDRSGDTIGAVCVITDITERRNLEEQLERNVADLASANLDLETFTHSVSHDLRNSLQIQVAMNDILEQLYLDRLDADGRKCLEEIGGAVRKMKRVIDGLLRLTRVAREPLRLEQVNVSDIAEAAVEELCRVENCAQSEIVIEPNMVAEADSDLLTIVYSNLIGNAFKFAADAETPRIAAGCAVQDNRTVFFVQDNGLGFDPADAQRVFAPFARLHQARGFGGHGLGLAIVGRIIRRHGGTVWAQGEPGKGATFFFTLPDKQEERLP